MLNAAVEHVDSSSEQVELVGVDRRKLNSCEDGMGKCGCIDEWCWSAKKPRPIVQIPKGHCQPGRVDSMSYKEMSVDGQGKSRKLVPITVELDDPGGGKKLHVYLGGTKM